MPVRSTRPRPVDSFVGEPATDYVTKKLAELDRGPFPRFKVVTCDLSRTPEIYEFIMNEILVKKTGRFEIVGDEKRTIDPMNGSILLTMNVIDNGPITAREDRY
jgi:hypothetical protein